MSQSYVKLNIIFVLTCYNTFFYIIHSVRYIFVVCPEGNLSNILNKKK
uniref:Uncharacterized protein n=1 Tax=Lutzomyia longipalpis TaxID=7200 RepID=A0A1B0C9K3_LUTLO